MTTTDVYMGEIVEAVGDWLRKKGLRPASGMQFRFVAGRERVEGPYAWLGGGSYLTAVVVTGPTNFAAAQREVGAE